MSLGLLFWGITYPVSYNIVYYMYLFIILYSYQKEAFLERRMRNTILLIAQEQRQLEAKEIHMGQIAHMETKQGQCTNAFS